MREKRSNFKGKAPHRSTYHTQHKFNQKQRVAVNKKEINSWIHLLFFLWEKILISSHTYQNRSHLFFFLREEILINSQACKN